MLFLWQGIYCKSTILGCYLAHLNLAILGVGIFLILTYHHKIAYNSRNDGPIFKIYEVPDTVESKLYKFRDRS